MNLRIQIQIKGGWTIKYWNPMKITLLMVVVWKSFFVALFSNFSHWKRSKTAFLVSFAVKFILIFKLNYLIDCWRRNFERKWLDWVTFEWLPKVCAQHSPIFHLDKIKIFLNQIKKNKSCFGLTKSNILPQSQQLCTLCLIIMNVK